MDGDTADSTSLRERLRHAVTRAHGAVRASQNPDGSWTGVIEAGSFGTAMTLVYERYLGALSDRDAREGAKFLRTAVRPDGSITQWGNPEAGSVDATVLWLAGMLAAGVPNTDPDVRAAQAWLDENGGIDAAVILSKAALAVAGGLDPHTLPAIPVSFELIPGMEDLAAKVLGVNALAPLHYLPGLLYGLRNGPPTWLRDPIAKAASYKVIEYFRNRRDPVSGGYMGVPFVTLAVVSCMVALGVPRNDELVTSALAFVNSTKHYDERGLNAQPFVAAMWDTAQYLRALLATGVSGDDPVIDRAVRFLLRHQTTLPSPRDWQTPPPNAPVAGGWPFEVGNELNPDIDSSQEVVGALARAASLRSTRDPELDQGIAKGLSWVLSMQNPDGGFSAFSWGKPSQQPGALFLPRPTPPKGTGLFARAVKGLNDAADAIVGAGDPSTADVTSRALWSFGAAGLRRNDPAVQRAVAFLEWQRYAGNGAFWGWWAVNYLPTTAYAITGHLESGGDPNEAWVREGVRFLLERQNHDGGWGDTPASYNEPWTAGRAASMRSITGFALWALCAAGHANDRAVARGFEYLLAHQREDGRWLDERAQGVLAPGMGYYTNSTYSTYTALQAAGAYIKATGG